jgi:hypothetical protein
MNCPGHDYCELQEHHSLRNCSATGQCANEPSVQSVIEMLQEVADLMSHDNVVKLGHCNKCDVLEIIGNLESGT